MLTPTFRLGMLLLSTRLKITATKLKLNCKCRQNFLQMSVSNIQCYTVLPVNVERISFTYLFQTYKSTRC